MTDAVFHCDKCLQYHEIKLGSSVFQDHIEYIVKGRSEHVIDDNMIISFTLVKEYENS